MSSFGFCLSLPCCGVAEMQMCTALALCCSSRTCPDVARRSGAARKPRSTHGCWGPANNAVCTVAAAGSRIPCPCHPLSLAMSPAVCMFVRALSAGSEHRMGGSSAWELALLFPVIERIHCHSFVLRMVCPGEPVPITSLSEAGPSQHSLLGQPQLRIYSKHFEWGFPAHLL